MKFRNHQGIPISEIGIGCYALSGVYGNVDIRAFQAVIRRAFELGINFFDTAEAYGDAERILGEAVRPFRKQVLVATKVGVKEGSKPNLSRKYILSACDDSLSALGMDYIDLYQVHFNDPETPVEESIRALEELVSAGKIRFWGIGHLPTERAIAYLDTGKVFSILMELSAAERSSLKSLLPLCIERGTAGIAFSVTGRGLLTGRYQEGHAFAPSDLRHIDPLFQRERFRSGLRIASKLAEIGRVHGRTPAQTAIAWVLAQAGIICALTGPSTIDHLEENAQASGYEVDATSLQALDVYLTVEQDRLKQEQCASLQEILAGKLPNEAQEAFVDLVYAIETILALDLASEEQIVPLFYDLYELRKTMQEPATRLKMEGMREKLNWVITNNPDSSIHAEKA
jgi:aryl-alcohol dehydrogenase-like predicted oxidoreductase